MFESIKQEVKKRNTQLVELRRHFHCHPEIAFAEHQTSAYLRNLLEKLGLTVTPMAGTGLRAVLEGRRGGRTVALRADMDALPIQEKGDKAYRSQNPGAMHACGHDGHMAILMGVAALLAERRDKLCGRVVLLFQPGEECVPGGAQPMIEAGALNGVEAIFGLHLWQSLRTGLLGINRGPIMAQADNFKLIIHGKGGHGSMPHQAVDPILAAAQVVVNLQSVVSRNIDPLKPAVLSFGTVGGGTIYNIIPGEVTLTGTVRTLEPAVQDLMKTRLQEVTTSTAATFGAKAEIEYIAGYPPVVNDPAMTDFVMEVGRRVLGDKNVQLIDPVMAGEDFAYYLQKVPGAFFFFGAGDGMPFPHHHPSFDLDECALPLAVELMTGLVLSSCNGASDCPIAGCDH